MVKVKKLAFLSIALLLPLLALTACSKVSLTGSTSPLGGTPPAGGPSEGTPPPDNGGTPPAGAPSQGSGFAPSGAAGPNN